MNCRVALCIVLLPFAVLAEDGRLHLAAELAIEGRYFARDPAFAQQRGGGLSLWAKPDISYSWSGGDQALTFIPYARWDQRDDQRTHGDIRELSWRGRFDTLELRAGIATVFWGTVESVHFVNIINQTDLVENPDFEDKLGQPMLQLSWTSPVGKFELFGLPYFRERRLAGPEGRLRAPLPFDEGPAIYESRREEEHLDAALRWSRSRKAYDLALSHFSGTARAPRFTPRATPTGTVLTPIYDLIEQTGLEARYRANALHWKLEAAHQESRAGHFTNAAGGFEVTPTFELESAWDVGLLAEYQWDEREQRAPSPFQNDLYLAMRFVANDASATEVLAGASFDLDHNSVYANVEASRRAGEFSKFVLEMRLYERSPPGDPLFNFRQDDYVQLEWIRFF